MLIISVEIKRPLKLLQRLYLDSIQVDQDRLWVLVHVTVLLSSFGICLLA
jgi:hypothetical protein